MGRRPEGAARPANVAEAGRERGNELTFYEVVVTTTSAVIARVGSLGTATHFSSFLSGSPSDAVVSSVSASAPVLVVLLAVARLVVELVAVLEPIMTGTMRGLSLASWREKSVKYPVDGCRVEGHIRV